jgi:glucuronate isomerase
LGLIGKVLIVTPSTNPEMVALWRDALRRRVKHFHQFGADVTAFLLDYADANRLSG